VLHPPAVVEFRISYTYPAYTRLPPQNVSNDDGTIEAPVGSEAALYVRATEPLADASMTTGGERRDLAPTADPAVREIHLTVRRDERYELHLTGGDGVTNAAAIIGSIRAIADTPPVVHLVDPASDLTARPTDVLPVRIQATDDYGVADLSIHLQGRDAKQAIQIPIAPPPAGSSVVHVDLSTISPAVGDVVSLWAEARDAIGQASSSEVRRVVISSNASSTDDRRRLAALIAASLLADQLAQEMGSAQADANPSQIAPVVETAPQLRGQLLRAILYGGGTQSQAVLLANLVDMAEQCHSFSEDLLRAQREWLTQHRDAIDAKLREAATIAETLAAQLHTTAVGETAAAAICERQALADLSPTAAPIEARENVAKHADDMIRSVRLDPGAPNVEARLQQLIVAARELATAQTPVDFAALARAWAEELAPPQPAMWPPLLDRRLAAAALAEALRTGGDDVWAGDLSLASRAVKRLSIPSTSTRSSDNPLVACPAAIAALQRAHELVEQRTELPMEVRTAADEAREQLRRWADDGTTNLSPEELAVAANAAAARGDDAAARDIDARLRHQATTATRPAAEQQAPAETIQQILAQQQQKQQYSTTSPSTASEPTPTAARRAAALERLAAVPLLAPLFTEPGAAGEGGAGFGPEISALAANANGPRGWQSGSRARPGATISPGRRTARPEFQEELNVYFDALSTGAGPSGADAPQK
jgi:hypothetical protein